jgi:putative transposase
MARICTFPVCPWGGPPKGCLALSKGTTFPSGAGFRNTSLVEYPQEKGCQSFVDETLIKVGSEYGWLRVAIEPKDRRILTLTTSKERNMFVAERFLPGLVGVHGNHPVSTDGGTRYPQDGRFLKLKHHIHSPLEKSLVERTMQYIKDRTECFDDCFLCRIKNCKPERVKNWLRLFVGYHNSELIAAK